MGFLDNAGLTRLWAKMKALVGIPIKRALTQAEYEALSEEEKAADVVYIITDDNGGVVENFNGRAGAVSPQEGDYSADMISGLSEALAAKQDKLTGAAGQVVGFDESGKAVAQKAPSGGMTQAEADARYIQPGGSYPGASYTQLGSFAFGDDGVISLSGRQFNSGLYFESVKTKTKIGNLAAPSIPDDAATKEYVDNKVRNAIWDGLYEPEGATFNIPGVFDMEPLVYEYQVGGLGVALAYVSFDEAHPANGTLSGSAQFNNIYASESSGRVEGLCFYQTPQGAHSMSYLTCTDGEDAFSFRVSVPANAVDGGELFILAFGNYK